MKTAMIPAIAGLLVLAASCKKSETPSGSDISCSGVSSTFSGQVQALVNTYCNTNAACHATGSVRGPGALVNYGQIFSSRAAIRSAVANGSMPQGATLMSAQKAQIICWIDAGAPNN